MVSLLDVNTLVALAWPNHVHYAAAHTWFERHHTDGWATCPLTESGFVRVSSNPAATREAKTPGEAVLLLRRMVDLPGHVFWDDSTSLARSEDLPLERLTGHQQVTDAHLLLLTIQHRGQLVTFDTGLRQLIPPNYEDDLLTILSTMQVLGSTSSTRIT